MCSYVQIKSNEISVRIFTIIQNYPSAKGQMETLHKEDEAELTIKQLDEDAREQKTKQREFHLERAVIDFSKKSTFGPTIKGCKGTSKAHFSGHLLLKDVWCKTVLGQIRQNLKDAEESLQEAQENLEESVAVSRSIVLELDQILNSSEYNVNDHRSNSRLIDALLSDLSDLAKLCEKTRIQVNHFLRFLESLLRTCFRSNYYEFQFINQYIKKLAKIFLDGTKKKLKEEQSKHTILIKSVKRKFVPKPGSSLRGSLKRLNELGGERIGDFNGRLEGVLEAFHGLMETLSTEFSNAEIKRKLDTTYLYMRFSQNFKEVGVNCSEDKVDIRNKALALNQESPFFTKFSLVHWFSWSKEKYTQSINLDLEKKMTNKWVQISSRIGKLERAAQNKIVSISGSREFKVRSLKFVQLLRESSREFSKENSEQTNSFNQIRKSLDSSAFVLLIDLENKLFMLYWRSKERVSRSKRAFLMVMGAFKMENPAHSMEVPPFHKIVKTGKKLLFKIAKNYRKDFIKFMEVAKAEFLTSLKLTHNNEFKEMGIHKIVACQIMLNRCEEDFSQAIGEIKYRLEMLTRCHDLDTFLERPIKTFIESLTETCNEFLQQLCWSSDQFLVLLRTYAYFAVTMKRSKKTQMKRVFEKMILLQRIFWGEEEIAEEVENLEEMARENPEIPTENTAKVGEDGISDVNLNRPEKEVVILSSNKNFVLESESVGEGYDDILHPQRKERDARNALKKLFGIHNKEKKVEVPAKEVETVEIAKVAEVEIKPDVKVEYPKLEEAPDSGNQNSQHFELELIEEEAAEYSTFQLLNY